MNNNSLLSLNAFYIKHICSKHLLLPSLSSLQEE